MIVCLPVKNGWQFAQTSTRSSGFVDPTVHSVPQDPQWTLASWYLGWMFGFTWNNVSFAPHSARARRYRGQASAATGSSAASAGSTRTRFLVLVACSNLTRPETVANTV